MSHISGIVNILTTKCFSIHAEISACITSFSAYVDCSNFDISQNDILNVNRSTVDEELSSDVSSCTECSDLSVSSLSDVNSGSD